MKIAVIHNLPNGGGNRYLSGLIQELKKTHEIEEIRISKKINNFIHYLYTLFVKLRSDHKKIAKKLNEKNYDFYLVTHDQLTKSPYILRYLTKPVVYICHEEPREFYNDSKYFNTDIKNLIVNTLRYPLKNIDKINTNYADILITNSIYSKKKLSKIYKRKFEVVYPGVNDKMFFINNKLNKKNYYLTIGSTSIFKGHAFIIDVIASLPSKLRLPLLIVGGVGRDHKKIVRLAKKKNVKLIHKTQVSDKELVKIYNNARLLLAAAYNEPFGLSIIEALSCGLSVVAVKEGGYSEILQRSKFGKLSKRNINEFKLEVIKEINTKLKKNNMHNYIAKTYTWKETANAIIRKMEPLT